jgi:hypothetical protein
MEKIEMIAQLNAGNKIKFQYVDRNRDYNMYPVTVTYKIDEYEGTILEVRDLTVNQLDHRTVARKPEIERSQYLLTVQLPDNKIKSFYDGRVINIQEVKEVPKSFLKRTLDKLRGK